MGLYNSNQSENQWFLPLITGMAILLFIPMFILQRLGWFDFWWWMSSNLLLLISLVWFNDHTFRQEIRDDLNSRIPYKILIGVFSALLLYGVFALGNLLIRSIFPGGAENISGVYDFKGSASELRIFLLMLLIIGPGEELFWRGFLQARLMKRWGTKKGFIAATLIYTGVHLLTGNPVLILAALTAGIFWGLMYLYFRSLTANMLSHIIWDISIFLLLPMESLF